MPDYKPIKSVKLVKDTYLVEYQDGTSNMLPRLTSVLNVLAKPGLVWWAANAERELCLDAAEETHLSPMTHVTFRERMLAILGDKKAHQKASQKAKDIGSETHALIQHDLRGRLGKFEPEPEHSEQAALAFMAWEDWRNIQDFEPVHCEIPIASSRLEVGGTCDAAGASSNGFIVCDWKSSKRSKSAPDGIYFEAKIQVAVYRALGIEMGLFPEDSLGCIVRLPKSIDDPVIEQKLAVDFKLIEPEECNELVRGFEHIRKTWAFMAQNGAL
jgi:hypothetical protein